MVIKLKCCRCQQIVGAEDNISGEKEYIGGATWWDDRWWCKDCYNKEIAENTDWLGGIDEYSE